VNDLILHVRHVRAAGMCARGLRAWCRSTGVDMRRLCDAGIPVREHPELVDDPFVQRAIEAASQEARDA
jgi:hypothetical protein